MPDQIDSSRTPLDPESRPRPQLDAIVHALHNHGVQWVLSGSVVAMLHGADIEPNDVDVVPELTPSNLSRLASFLEEVDAVPAFIPEWTKHMASREDCFAWNAFPPTSENLDNLFVTNLGMVDVTPTFTGTYESLSQSAHVHNIADVSVQVCELHEVLNRLPAKMRAKDIVRRTEYDKLRKDCGLNPSYATNRNSGLRQGSI